MVAYTCMKRRRAAVQSGVRQMLLDKAVSPDKVSQEVHSDELGIIQL